MNFSSLRKHPFVLAVRRWGRFASKRMFSQASIDNAKKLEVGDKESWTAILFVVARNLDENSS